MTRRLMDLLTITAAVAFAGMVIAFILLQGHRDEAAPAWPRAAEILLAVVGIALAIAGTIAIAAQWLAVAAYTARRGHWGWFFACLAFTTVGSTIAYLYLRKRWDTLPLPW